MNNRILAVALFVLALGCGEGGGENPGGSGGTGGTGGNTGTPPRCGDGVVDEDTSPFETCDDGNTISGDGCSNTCRIEIVEWRGEILMTGTETHTDLGTGEVFRTNPVECTGSLQVYAEGPTSAIQDAAMSCRLISSSSWSFRDATRSGDDLSNLNITFNADFFPCQGEGLGLFGSLTYERDAGGHLTSSAMEGTFMKVCQREDTATRSRVEFTGTFEATTSRIQEL